MNWQWNLIQAQCTGCGICDDVCGYAAIAMPREMAYPQAVPGKCVGCLDCVQQCPFDAVDVREFEPA